MIIPAQFRRLKRSLMPAMRASGAVLGWCLKGLGRIIPAQLPRLKRSLLVAVLASGAGLGWYLNRPSGNPLQYEMTVVTRGELTQLVTATGELTPLVKVEVGSQISGIIPKLFVDFNSPVT